MPISPDEAERAVKRDAEAETTKCYDTIDRALKSYYDGSGSYTVTFDSLKRITIDSILQVYRAVGWDVRHEQGQQYNDVYNTFIFKKLNDYHEITYKG